MTNQLEARRPTNRRRLANPDATDKGDLVLTPVDEFGQTTDLID
jgi:hypothetical protein